MKRFFRVASVAFTLLFTTSLFSCLGLSDVLDVLYDVTYDQSSNYPRQVLNETVVFSGNKTFNDWSSSIQITNDKFADFTSGSKIVVTTSTTKTDYQKLKFNIAANYGWTEMRAGSYSGGTYDSQYGGVEPTSNTVTYVVTTNDANSLKTNGFALNGYGVNVTKITLVTQGVQTVTQTTTMDKPLPQTVPTSKAGTPYKNHGKLHVNGAYLYDEHNQQYQLYGMSTHGLNFGKDYSRYVNKAAFASLVDDWNTNCIRLALYPKDYNGYCNGGDKTSLKKLIYEGIEYATQCGMYVIVDWHVLNYNPNDTKTDAKIFFAEISAKYSNYGNIIYEICNEPTNSPWNSVLKPYAQEIIPIIRDNAPDAVIIVGTNTWSQDVEDPVKYPLSYNNIMYAFHFYAASHTTFYRMRVENAIKNGLPIFITEFGTCDSSGNGNFNSSETEKWFDLIEKYGISHINWSLSNKNETASALSVNCNKTSGWSENDLTESGKLVRHHFKLLKR